MDAALIALKTAAELQPDVPRNAYVYGVALNSTGNSAEAMKVLKQSFQTNPRDRETNFMIASIYRDQGNIAQARAWAQKLLDINPADQNATQFIESLKAAKQ